MKFRFAITVLSCVCLAQATPTPEQMQVLVRSRPEADEIRWKDPARGAPLKVRIIQSTSQAVTVEKLLPSGLTVRTIPLVELSGIDFALTPREVSFHQKPAVASIPPLRVYWETRQATMRLPGSNAAETGLALAKSLRLTGQPADLDEAGKILDQIRSQDTVPHRVDLARAEQATIDFTRVLKTGNPAEIDKLAWKITEQPDNPEAMLLATAFLADRHFAELKSIESENPRWMEDDEVKPVRERVYHLALDFSLYPSLFLASHEPEVAAGLKRAVEIYQFTGGNAAALGKLEDLAALYPESEATKETAPLLARLKQAEAAGKLADAPAKEEEKPEEEKNDQETSPTRGPAPTKRYNIFGD